MSPQRGSTRAFAAALALAGALGLAACTSSDDEKASGSSGSSGSSASSSASTSGSPASPTVSTSPPPAPATTPVPPPTAGNISQTVPPVSVETKPPAPLDKPVDVGAGVTAQILKVTPTNATAKLPGEIAGPAVKFTVQIINKSGAAIDLSNVVINVYDDTDVPGGQITSGTDQGVSGSLKAGGTTSGSYLFTVPAARRTPLTIEVIYQAGKPVAQFVGNVG